MLGRISTNAIICVVIAYVAFHHSSALAASNDFDECLVNEMRGQSIFMEPEVRKLCAKRFSLEYDITGSGITIDWGVNGGPQPFSTTKPGEPTELVHTPIYTLILKVHPNNTEWYVTKATMSFAYRRCDAQPPLDPSEFTGRYTTEFKEEVANVKLPGSFDQRQQTYVPPACQRIDQLWGRYR